MSPQCSRIDRVTRAVSGGDLGRVVGAGRRAGDGGDAGLGVDEVVEPGDQRLLGPDAVVHGLRRDAGGLGDVAHARAGVAALGEQAPGGPEDLVPRQLRLALTQRGGGLRSHRPVYHLTSVQVIL